MKEKMIKYYMNTALNTSKLSVATRLKVGCVIVKNDNIISFSWNGTPSGLPNCCEHSINGVTITKPETIHAELNAIFKLSKNGISGNGATMFVTHSPCIECAKGIIQTGIESVYYLIDYRDSSGIELLKKCSINISKYTGDINVYHTQTSHNT